MTDLQRAIDAIEKLINTGDKLLEGFQEGEAARLSWKIKRDAFAMAIEEIKIIQREEEPRLYIKIFADSSSNDKAQRMYQICDDDELPEVIQALCEYADVEKPKISNMAAVIMNVEYAADVLKSYKNITESGDCNVCGNKGCGYAPKLGDMVRYNCPFFTRKEE